jgi:putative endonuclease
LRLVARNVRSPFGEIDLVMEDAETLIFVEVRYRNTQRFGGPAESVDGRKQRKLRATAEHFLQRNAKLARRPCRFDVVAITAENGAPEIEWIPDAF